MELARALCRAQLLLLDEPTAGMNVEEKEDMAASSSTSTKYGVTVVLIEHDMGVVMDISNRVMVLDYGEIIGDGAPGRCGRATAVIDAYLGVAH